MDDLFEKLKAEPPVDTKEKSLSNKPKESNVEQAPMKKISEDVDGIAASPKLDVSDSAKQRSASSTPDFSKARSRSHSPTQAVEEETNKLIVGENSGDEEPVKKLKRTSSKDSDTKETENSNASPSGNETPKKQMPTKAQQKLFETPAKKNAEVKDNIAANDGAVGKTDSKAKRCRVRIKRENLEKLRERCAIEQAKIKSMQKQETTKSKDDSPPKVMQKAGKKRKADEGNSPPAKKVKNAGSGSPTGKKNKPAGFFIKLGNKRSPPTNKEKENSLTKPKDTSLQAKKSPQPKEKPLRKSMLRSTSSTLNVSVTSTTKATKFTRSQLIRQFGKRYFNSRVRIERCKHPLMLTFESNARARKVKAKNKSKNLSVSFKAEVEILGFSDTESSECDEANLTNSSNATTTDGTMNLLAGVTPLHLKKVENGKVIDDIEFDPKLFGDPNSSKSSSTPLRKKLEKKSYSPLKDDSSPSARSELLKSANEKLPPSALRRLPAEDEDDEDDECEWIVPIDIPERRLSHNSISEKDAAKSPTNSEVQKDDEKKEGDANAPAAKEIEVQTAVVNNDIKETSEKSTAIKQSSDNEKPERLNGNDAKKAIEINEENSVKQTDKDTASEDLSKIDFPALMLETDTSSPATPNPTIASENHAAPDSLLKTAINKLSEFVMISASKTV